MGDRIGAILFNDSDTLEARPTRNERKVMGWLGDLTDMNNDLSVAPNRSSNPQGLAQALQLLERSIGHDYLVVLISDFYGWDENTIKTIRRISQHNDIICSLVFDPLERDISRANKLVVSDGKFQLEIDPARQGLGEKFEASFRKLGSACTRRAQAPSNSRTASQTPLASGRTIAGKTGRPEGIAVSAPPLPETFGNYALGDFAEVVSPAAISWLPQTRAG